MLDELKSMAVFCKVVECGSFRGAATQLKLSPSVISHHIAQLEKKTGVALLYRSTRKLSLTALGEMLYQSSKALVMAAETGLDQLAQCSEQPQGNLTISMAAVLCKSPFMAAICDFSNQYDQVTLSVKVTDTMQDLIEEGVDVALRIGTMKDSLLKSRKIYQIKRVLVASPNLLEKYGTPRRPSDLHNLPWVAPSMLPCKRLLKGPMGEETTVTFEPKIRIDSVDAACQMALHGAGITSPPDYLIADSLLKGDLIELLPDWEVAPINVYAVWQPNAHKANLINRFKKHLIEAIECTLVG